MITEPEEPKMIQVLWRDCQTLDGWHCGPDVLEMFEDRRMIRTIGFLLKKNKDQIVLAAAWEPIFGKVCASFCIPMAQVVEVQELRVNDGGTDAAQTSARGEQE